MHKGPTFKTRIVAITGGIGSGKSAVGNMLAGRGFTVIDTDRIAHDLTAAGLPAVREIAGALGEGVLTPDGGLDRKKVADIIFSNTEKRKALEAILHPVILDESRRQAQESDRRWVFLLIPLLFETDRETTVDRIWLCFAPVEVRISRAAERDGVSRDDIEARIRAQIPDETKLERVDFVLDTSLPLSEVEAQVDEALMTLEDE
jgi:dephospho-CoA kinase